MVNDSNNLKFIKSVSSVDLIIISILCISLCLSLKFWKLMINSDYLNFDIEDLDQNNPFEYFMLAILSIGSIGFVLSVFFYSISWFVCAIIFCVSFISYIVVKFWLFCKIRKIKWESEELNLNKKKFSYMSLIPIFGNLWSYFKIKNNIKNQISNEIRKTELLN